MLSTGHVASGITTGLCVLAFTKYNIDLKEFIPGLILGSLTPDIDTGKSWVSQTVPLIDDTLRKCNVLKHRGVTHGITGIIGMILLYFFIPNNLTLGFGIGYITHCVTDSILSLFKIDINTKNNQILYNIFWVLNVILIGFIIYNKLKGSV